MSSPIARHDETDQQRALADWALRDVVIGVAVLIGFRSLSLVGPETFARAPTWLRVGPAVLIPQFFLVAYAIWIARRRGIAVFRFPPDRMRRFVVEPLIALAVVGGLIAALIVASVIVSLLSPGATLTPEVIEQAARSSSPLFVVFMILVAVFVAPICEEVFFRGFLQAALRSRMPVVVAALVQSAIFAVLHTFGAVHGIVAFILGLVLTFVYEWRKTLLASIVVHAGNNAFAALGFIALVLLNANSPVLGVHGHDHPQGCQVDKVVPETPAAKAGIAEGDIITNVAGEPVTGFRQLVSVLVLHQVGETVKVEVLRNGEPRVFQVVLEKRPASP